MRADTDTGEEAIRLVAFYLPQYHVIPENNAWWGDGFTEWVNVKKAGPLFKGHNQPRVPLNNYYYDLSDLKSIEWQVDLARNHGIHGFCHYHYWFDGKQLLQTPTDLFLSAKHLDFKICLAWANETWSRRWDGQDHHILQLQTHDPDKGLWENHFNYLIKAWTDERAIRINNKPVFVIYRPHKINQIENMFDYWQTRAHSYGLDGIHFLTMKQFAFPNPACIRHFDGTILFQPFDAQHNVQMSRKRDHYNYLIGKLLPESLQKLACTLKYHLKDKYGSPTLVDYDEIWKQIISGINKIDEKLIPGAFVDWDNTARYGRRATVFKGSTPERFEYWLIELISAMVKNKRCEQLIFINAWNEWAEGTYLEPDERNGYGYLEAVRNALEKTH